MVIDPALHAANSGANASSISRLLSSEWVVLSLPQMCCAPKLAGTDVFHAAEFDDTHLEKLKMLSTNWQAGHGHISWHAPPWKLSASCHEWGDHPKVTKSVL